MLDWVILSLKHIKHTLGDDESSSDVNRGDENRGSCQGLHGVMWHISATHEQKSSDSCNTGNSVCDRHKWGM